MTTAPADARSLTIRQVERADLLDVFRIEKQCFTQPWPFAAFETFLGESGFLLGERNGVVVGYAVADIVPNYGQDIGHIKDLAVHPNHRGQGIGRRLLTQALTRLLLEGAAVAKLEVREGNDPALALYRETGFAPARRMPRYYDDGETAIVMTIDLEAWARRSDGE